MSFTFTQLSGGLSKRFGSDKTKALYNGKELYIYGLETGLKVSSDVLHLSKDKNKYKPFLDNVSYIEDEYDVVCPMSGLITAGKHAKFDNIFVISADAPKITPELIYFLEKKMKSNGATDYDAVIPEFNGKLYTLSAMYKKHVLLSFIDDYNLGKYKIITSLENFNVAIIKEEELQSMGFSKSLFTNINFEKDLRDLEESNS